MPEEAWPELPYEAWKESLDTLHMVSQIVGKVGSPLRPSSPSGPTSRFT
jgi:hypothetical protein